MNCKIGGMTSFLLAHRYISTGRAIALLQASAVASDVTIKFYVYVNCLHWRYCKNLFSGEKKEINIPRCCLLKILISMLSIMDKYGKELTLAMLNKNANSTSNCQPVRVLDPNCWYKFTYWMAEANWSGSSLFAKAGYIWVQQDKGECFPIFRVDMVYKKWLNTDLRCNRYFEIWSVLELWRQWTISTSVLKSGMIK